MRDDLYQEVCLKLVEHDFRRIRVYRASGSFRSYLLTVVDNIVVDALRREIPGQRVARPTSRQSRIPLRSISLTDLMEQDDLAIRDTAPDPEETLIGIEEERVLSCQLDAMRSVFTSLTAEQRAFLTIVGAASDSMPPRRIARLMGLDVRAVYQLRRSIRRHVIRALEGSSICDLRRKRQTLAGLEPKTLEISTRKFRSRFVDWQLIE